jgi:hypothetical protein
MYVVLQISHLLGVEQHPSRLADILDPSTEKKE